MPTGIYVRTEKHREILRRCHLGMKYKPMSLRGRTNISLNAKGKKHNEETKRKISLNNLGKHKYWFGKRLSDEHKCKLSIAIKGLKRTEEFKKKMSIVSMGRKFSQETRIKMSNAQRGEKGSNWKGGITFIEYPPTFNQQLKDKMRVRDNFKCRVCGIPELECGKRLNIHHIDYDKKNNSEDNLISLCNKCHGKTIIDREYWKNKLKNTAEIAELP